MSSHRAQIGLLPLHLTFFFRQVTHAKVTLTLLGLSTGDLVIQCQQKGDKEKAKEKERKRGKGEEKKSRQNKETPFQTQILLAMCLAISNYVAPSSFADIEGATLRAF
jgi:hypothetical protein